MTRSSKSNKPTKRQASKGSKEIASNPKHANKPAKAKSPTPSPPTPSPPTPSPLTPTPPPSSSTSHSPQIKFCGPHLALNWDVFPRLSKKVARVQAKPLQNLEDLAQTVDEHFVLDFLAEVPILPLESPPTAEETLIQLDCLLSWCFPVLRQLEDQWENESHMEQGRINLQPRKIDYQIPQLVVSQETNSSGPEVPQPKIIRFRSPPAGTSEEGIRGNVHPESLESS
ncbi:hypothetical protein DSO57_1034109 [Entomophthora muscae]|uniref:Uncharacterized protein n=1 Tax=Entomophthora muscae TaxID=34485 RepID=A0ACC2U8X1_9FUNG|nr:hypothetical protein DSO57_1034109 [Entomophthora muscae]